MAEAEEVIRRIKARAGNGLLVVDRAQRIVRSSYAGEQAGKADALCGGLPLLLRKAEDMVREVDPSNALLFLRLKLRSGEFLLAPDSDLLLIVAQAGAAALGARESAV